MLARKIFDGTSEESYWFNRRVSYLTLRFNVNPSPISWRAQYFLVPMIGPSLRRPSLPIPHFPSRLELELPLPPSTTCECYGDRASAGVSSFQGAHSFPASLSTAKCTFESPKLHTHNRSGQHPKLEQTHVKPFLSLAPCGDQP